ALLHGDRTVSWAELDRRANGIAATLLDAGVTEGTGVAQYLTNRPEYLETVFAAFKLGLAPVNTNYRYVEAELAYLWENADVSAVVFEARFSDRVEALRDRTRAVKIWLWMDDGSGSCPEWAVDVEVAADRETGSVRA